MNLLNAVISRRSPSLQPLPLEGGEAILKLLPLALEANVDSELASLPPRGGGTEGEGVHTIAPPSQFGSRPLRLQTSR